MNLQLVNSIAAAIVDAVYPPVCVLCGGRGADRLDLCAGCRGELRANTPACARCAAPLTRPASTCGSCQRRTPPYTAARAAFRYAQPLDSLVHALKFRGDLSAGRALGNLMVETFSDVARPQAMLAVPLHAGRLRRRGFNQAHELARVLKRRLSLPLIEGALRRGRATPPQSSLDDPAERRRNMRDAFVARASALPGHVALVDDVMTSGATVAAAAEALRGAGVERVDVWVAARAAPRAE